MQKGFILFFILLNSIAVSAQLDAGLSKALPLTSKPSIVQGVNSAVLSLAGDWDFSISHSRREHKIKVPREWEMQGFKVNEGETALYKRMLSIPEDWRGKRIILRFEGVSSHAVVKVNGKIVVEHDDGFVPFNTDITDALQNSNNVLIVEVQSRTISDILACTSQYAVHTVGGILRDVVIMAVPEEHITNLSVVTTFDKQYKTATLSLNYNLSETAVGSILQYTLRDKQGKIVFQEKTSNPSFQKTRLNVRQWNPEHPYLYELTTELLENGKAVQAIKQKIGFRQVEINGARLFVNGKPVKLHGVNRHSVHPLTGRSIGAALDVQDAILFREANCNFIRTSHYPATEAFLDACDSLGLFVEDESSLCWIQHHASPIWKKWDYNDERFLPFMLQANIEKVIAHRNHPSVIMWSLGNESAWSPLWATVNEAGKQLDPTRPTLFHDQCWGGFNNYGSKRNLEGSFIEIRYFE